MAQFPRPNGRAGPERPCQKLIVTAGSRDRPLRLVEISHDARSLKLVDGDITTAPYVALSYVWGKQTATWRTVSSNLAARKIRFDVQNLPSTLRDAVLATHGLRCRLLWVDCLCIVQDDPDEWRKEAARMASIYKHAILTLSADSSKGSDGGLFNIKSRSSVEQAQHVCIRNRFSDGRASVLHARNTHKPLPLPSYHRSLVSKRAWCLQEHLAAPRALHFGESQLFWRCLHCSLSEDKRRHHHTRRHVTERIADKRVTNGASCQWWTTTWYHELVQRGYSRREPTFPNARLNAIAGLAAFFASPILGRYFAGHWQHKPLASLCWCAQAIRSEPIRTTTAYRAPT